MSVFLSFEDMEQQAPVTLALSAIIAARPATEDSTALTLDIRGASGDPVQVRVKGNYDEVCDVLAAMSTAARKRY